MVSFRAKSSLTLSTVERLAGGLIVFTQPIRFSTHLEGVIEYVRKDLLSLRNLA
jgi:hypothetical protein